MINRHLTKINGSEIEYLDQGSGQVILLLHGALASFRFYQDLIDELSKSYRVIAPTMPGMGKSQSIKQPSLAKYSTIALQLLQQLQISQAIFVGHSMGGAIAANCAATAPGSCSNLILVDAAGIPYYNQAWQTVSGWIGGFFEYQKYKRSRSLLDKLLPWDMRHMLPRLITSWQVGRVLANIDLRTVYPKLQMPILILWGGRDNHFPASNAYKIAAYTKTSHTVVLPDYNHNWIGYHTEVAKKLIDDFIHQTN
jgi:pimeloyl-ACP methyl ester carboxylesterase